MAGIGPLRPYHNYHATSQAPDANDSFFSVVEAIVDHVERFALEDCCGVLESKSPLVECRVTFGDIERYSHVIYCIPKKTECKRFLTPKIWGAVEESMGMALGRTLTGDKR